MLQEYKATCIKSSPLRGLCKHAWRARLAEHRLESAVPKDVSDRDTAGPWPCHCLQSPARSLCWAWQSLPSDCALFTSDLGMSEHCWLLSLSAAPPCLHFPLFTTFFNLQHWFYISLTLLNPHNCSRARIPPPNNQLAKTLPCVNLTLLECCLLYPKPTQTWDNGPKSKLQFLPEEESSFSCYLLH